MKIFGREPALIIAVLVALIQALGAFAFKLTPGTEGGLIALVTAAGGVWTAFHLPDWQDKALPALLGFAQAGFALYLAFGHDLPATQQATIMNLITVVFALVVRRNVNAPVPPAPPVAEGHLITAEPTRLAESAPVYTDPPNRHEDGPY